MFAVFAVLLMSACASAPADAQSGNAEVEILYGEWRDAVRDRVVPYKMYLPADHRPAPVVIFSHGLGGSREAAGYLMEHLAANGIVGIVIQHPGSDASLLSNGEGRPIERLRSGVTDGRAAVARFGDVRFVIDRVEAESIAGPLAGRLDPSRLGMSGHSYGALTTLVAVGQRLAAGPPDAFLDPRIDAAIAYSPNAPRNMEPNAALSEIRTPILHFTGTDDRTPFDLEASPVGRQIPYRTISGADQYLIVFDGGDHAIFSGRQQATGQLNAAQRAQTEAIERETLTFWRAYLLGDDAALADLCRLPDRVDAIATGEIKAARCNSAGGD